MHQPRRQTPLWLFGWSRTLGSTCLSETSSDPSLGSPISWGFASQSAQPRLPVLFGNTPLVLDSRPTLRERGPKRWGDPALADTRVMGTPGCSAHLCVSPTAFHKCLSQPPAPAADGQISTLLVTKSTQGRIQTAHLQQHSQQHLAVISTVSEPGIPLTSCAKILHYVEVVGHVRAENCEVHSFTNPSPLRAT